MLFFILNSNPIGLHKGTSKGSPYAGLGLFYRVSRFVVSAGHGFIAEEGCCVWFVFLYSTIHCLIKSIIVRFIRFGRRHYHEVEAVFYIG
jgi:hypothetical protein